MTVSQVWRKTEINDGSANYWELVWCVSCSTLPRSLSSAIDPGITFRPCIALTTEERDQMFNRRFQIKKSTKVQICRSLTPSWLFSLARPMSGNAQEKQKQLSWSREREMCFTCCLQGPHSLSHVPAQSSTMQHVRRRLQFVPVSRYVFSPHGVILDKKNTSS